MSTADGASDGHGERRGSERVAVVVPATIQLDTRDYTAKILNVVHEGAMLETSAPVEVDSRLVLRCGTVAANAVVVWTDAGRIGINFETPLSHAQVSEQLSRSTALSARRASKHQS